LIIPHLQLNLKYKKYQTFSGAVAPDPHIRQRIRCPSAIPHHRRSGLHRLCSNFKLHLFQFVVDCCGFVVQQIPNSRHNGWESSCSASATPAIM